MNWAKFFFAFIAAFLFLFIFGFLWYGTLMQGAHHEVATLLRPESAFKSYFGWLIFGHIVMAFFFTILCVRFVPAGWAGSSAALGALVGLVYSGPDLVAFAVQPFTIKILCGWTDGAEVQFALAAALGGQTSHP